MKNFIQINICVLVALLLSNLAQAQDTFTPPESSASALAGVNFNGEVVGQSFIQRFLACDKKDTCDGSPMKYKCSTDANRNSTLLKLKGGTIFFDGKMAIDADGSPYSNGRHATVQAQTSLRYPMQGDPSVNADKVPFIVIPSGGFSKELGIEVGDVAAVVYGDKQVFAIVADTGPKCKIGEGSIQLHELFGHAVCTARSDSGDCKKLNTASIGKNVMYFIFPGTRNKIYPGLTPENINERIQSVGADAWQQLVTP